MPRAIAGSHLPAHVHRPAAAPVAGHHRWACRARRTSRSSVHCAAGFRRPHVPLLAQRQASRRHEVRAITTLASSAMTQAALSALLHGHFPGRRSMDVVACSGSTSSARPFFDLGRMPPALAFATLDDVAVTPGHQCRHLGLGIRPGRRRLHRLISYRPCCATWPAGCCRTPDLRPRRRGRPRRSHRTSAIT